ncbi:MAG: enoyl-CoA hydratase/isomerase family protein, partial [Chloroflexi bacterium]|nr:enoyl-CoA hydratase/isomerase family protein [Chloroflexota bacterium]
MNRPERRNAMDGATLEALGTAIEQLGKEDDVRVVIITGSGGSFCAGADTDEMLGGKRPGPHALGEAGTEGLRRGFESAQRVILGLHRMEKPTIAMVDGPAVGAGFDIACACDIRTGSSTARFMSAFVRIGLFPGYGGTWLYPRLLGLGKAAELLFTGDFLEAEEAYNTGFLNRLESPEDLEEVTMKLARKIADGPPIAHRLAKMMMYRGLEMDLDTAMHMAAAAESITLSSADHSEGLN